MPMTGIHLEKIHWEILEAYTIHPWQEVAGVQISSDPFHLFTFVKPTLNAFELLIYPPIFATQMGFMGAGGGMSTMEEMDAMIYGDDDDDDLEAELAALTGETGQVMQKSKPKRKGI